MPDWVFPAGVALFIGGLIVLGAFVATHRRRADVRFARHAATAMAVLQPDALPPCECVVCAEFTPTSISDAFWDTVDDEYDDDELAELEELAAQMPPVIPGRE